MTRTSLYRRRSAERGVSRLGLVDLRTTRRGLPHQRQPSRLRPHRLFPHRERLRESPVRRLRPQRCRRQQGIGRQLRGKHRRQARKARRVSRQLNRPRLLPCRSHRLHSARLRGRPQQHRCGRRSRKARQPRPQWAQRRRGPQPRPQHQRRRSTVRNTRREPHSRSASKSLSSATT